MAMEINTVLNKDCMDGMASMDGGSVDLVIADPPYFQGNGTTAVACIRTGRNYIGFELNHEYYEVCRKRILNENCNLFK